MHSQAILLDKKPPKHPQLFEDFRLLTQEGNLTRGKKICKLLKCVNVKEKKRPTVVHGPTAQQTEVKTYKQFVIILLPLQII
jgi:hypothetical protein